MRTFKDLESKPRLSKLIKLLDSLVPSNQMLKNGKGLRSALWGHASKIRGTDYTNYIPNSNAFTRHISAL